MLAIYLVWNTKQKLPERKKNWTIDFVDKVGSLFCSILKLITFLIDFLNLFLLKYLKWSQNVSFHWMLSLMVFYSRFSGSEKFKKKRSKAKPQIAWFKSSHVLIRF